MTERHAHLLQTSLSDEAGTDCPFIVGEHGQFEEASGRSGRTQLFAVRHAAALPCADSGGRVRVDQILHLGLGEVSGCLNGKIILGNEPRTRRSRRSVPVAHAVMRQLEEHLRLYVDPESDAPVFTGSRGGPMFRATFARDVWRPAARRAVLSDVTFHTLRHSFVAILVAAG